MKKNYIVDCFGNYSYSYNWDDGITSFGVKELTDDIVQSWTKYVTENPSMGDYITGCEKLEQIYCNEHGGSRNVTVVVEADSEEEAEKIVKDWCEEHYPKYYEED